MFLSPIYKYIYFKNWKYTPFCIILRAATYIYIYLLNIVINYHINLRPIYATNLRNNFFLYKHQHVNKIVLIKQLP